MARNQFECLKYKAINVVNVPAKQLILREIVRTQSIMWWPRLYEMFMQASGARVHAN